MQRIIAAALLALVAFAAQADIHRTGTITEAVAGADASWLARSTAAGVWYVNGVDTTSIRVPCGGTDWPGTNDVCYNPGSCGNKLTVDTAVYASGVAGGNHKSYRLDTQSCGDSNQSGDILIGLPTTRGVGSHFYYSFAWRAHGFTTGTAGNWTSPAMTGQGWKTSVLAHVDGPLCGTNELTTVNFDYENKQRLYTACSNSQHDNFEFPDGSGGFNQQQGDYTCKYMDGNIQADCRVYPADTWEWFYLDVAMRSGQADVKAYSCHAGDGRWKQWINAPAYTWGANSFGMLDLSDYDTSKSGTTPTASAYSMWWDEIIFSDLPIAIPSGCS